MEKTVAEEEERIKAVRLVSEAERTKRAAIIKAEAEAEAVLVTDIKAAEAAYEASKHKAQEQMVLAEAERETSEKKAAAKIRMAEGVQAEAAWQSGLQPGAADPTVLLHAPLRLRVVIQCSITPNRRSIWCASWLLR